MTKILAIDDSILYRKYLESLLEGYGFQVFSVESAEAALQVIKIDRPDIIILDVVLQGMSGWQLCRQLKNERYYQDIPIVICSSKSTSLDKKWTEMLGADAHLTKPIDTEKLLAKLEELTLIQA